VWKDRERQRKAEKGRENRLVETFRMFELVYLFMYYFNFKHKIQSRAAVPNLSRPSHEFRSPIEDVLL
jgi:hypothetical protein